MRISTKGRYALRLMLDLAVNGAGENIPIKDIAARQEISIKYLEQIIPMLVKAGYVRSVRGSSGGYMLSKRADQYTVGMILRTTEGSLSPVACLDAKDSCHRESMCVTYEVWERIQKAVEDVVDSITLEDLVQRYREKNSLDFCI